MIEQLTNNWICWVILVLALVCYQQLWLAVLTALNQHSTNLIHTIQAEEQLQQEYSEVLIAALPLLGLLGTIMGLLDCFAGMATGSANSELISVGIAEALLTTQLGLVCAIPAWLLHAWLHSANQNATVASVEVR